MPFYLCYIYFSHSKAALASSLVNLEDELYIISDRSDILCLSLEHERVINGCGIEGDGSEIQSVLTEWTGQQTLPNVFVGGNHIGDCDSRT